MTSRYYEAGHTSYKLENVASQDSRVLNVISTVRARCPAGGKVLDMGCGDMFLRSQLPGLEYTGVDLDTAKAPGAVKHDLAQTPYPFPDASFDVVICSEVLEHLWEPEKSLAEIARIMKPTGTLVLTVPNFNCIDLRLTNYETLVYDRENVFSVEHIRQYTPESMIRLLDTAGIGVKNILGNSAHMSGFFLNAREALSKFLKANNVHAPSAGVDQVIGLMFPTLCPGFMVEAGLKRDSSSQTGAD